MIGEFYLRTMLDLYNLISSTHTFISQDETQYYVHIAYENKKMLDAHKLMLSGMHPLRPTGNNAVHPNSSIRWAKSAVDLMEPEHDGVCQCYSKLIFCGYNVTYTRQSLHNTSDNSTQNKFDLWPSTFVDAASTEIKGVTSSCDPISPLLAQDPYKCQVYAKLKAYLLSNIESHYNNIEDSVAEYRRQILRERNLINESYNGDTREWAVVGLAQRSSRRVWLNLTQIMDVCNNNSQFRYQNDTQANVVCIEVNVENTTTPHEQFLLHRSLDALIGVHGAQMTQALFMRPTAHVLELLPWIPVSIHDSIIITYL
jgi:hypothetical protein